MNDTSSVGSRIRQGRDRRGLTQAQLAERAGLSPVYVSDIERGAKRPGLGALNKIAGALGIEMAWLLDRQERLAPDGADQGILGVRDAMLSAEDIPGLAVAGDTGTPQPGDGMERRVDAAWDTYWDGRFGWLADEIPRLLADGRATEREARGEQAQAAACKALAQAYQLTGCWLVHMGADDLAFAAARRGIIAAAGCGDALQHAAVLGTLSWVALHQGRLEMAESVAVQAAESVRPGGRVPLEHRAVYGALLLTALAPAATAGNADAAAGYVDAAREQALWFTEGDLHPYRTNFGPVQLAMQRTYAWATLREPAKALEAARQVDRAGLLPISWGAHHLDKAQAYLDAGRRHAALAVEALCTALDVSPDWAAHQGLFRTLAGAAVQASTRRSPGATRLARAANIG